MKKRKLLFLILAVLLIGLAGWWYWRQNSATPAKKSPAKNANAKPAANVSAAASSSIRVSSVVPANNLSVGQNPAGGQAQPEANIPQSIPDTDKMQMVLDAQNNTPLDFFGRVIDQYGAPVVGANIRGNVLKTSFEGTASQDNYTTTDAAGGFQFVGLHGAQLFIMPQKDGYEFTSAGAANWSKNYQADSANPMVFTMYKLQGAEPMVHTQFDSRVPYDGTSAAFDLFTGKKTNTGDLKITLIRNPLQVKRGQDHFEWSVQIEITDGGLIESHDSYPYEAPQNGYQGIFDFSQAKNAANWTQRLTKTFYVHTKGGNYGRVMIDLTTDSERPDTGISIEAYINPAPGSENLEYDGSKVAKPPFP